MKKISLFAITCCALATLATAQNTQAERDIIIGIVGGERPAIAIPDLRGAGDAQKYMGTFNQVLWDEIQGSGFFKVVPKGLMPRGNPQTPQDIRESSTGTGLALSDWSSPPPSANYLAFGYTGVQGSQLVLFGWLFNVKQPQQSAQVIGKIYNGALSEQGARQVAREFAADILKLFGLESLVGSKIYFVSNRSGEKQIYVMDYDGTNQRVFAPYKELCTMPAVSPDGSKVAFTRFAPGPVIMMHSAETGRKLNFFNPNASFNSNISFTPDGSKVVLASKVSGFAQIHMANADGSGLVRISNSRAIEVEPKINPKTGTDIAFVSGRSGLQQIYKMNIDGADVTRLTGEGQASNPSWHPNGKFLAYSWTRGFEPGNWNVFIMDVSKQTYVQLTHGQGRNENPTWAPDGRHIVFASNRNGTMQIYTMLADGTDVRQLTKAGKNEMPVWSK
ncbi:MAG: PD40 domain-containing protein [Acidobacteria bacterium]|nr:PD40 domain-containing protein [Acidobacteriota bacterium]